jgi:hypothetical protein
MANAYSFKEDPDTILNEILRDYENQLSDIDRSVGTITHIHATALRNALWGIYERIDRVGRQIFPDTADSRFLERHCAIYGITRDSGESDASLLSRLISRLRNPPAGGNKYDWPRWAEAAYYEHTGWTERCKKAFVDEGARGSGTVNTAIQSDRTEDPGDYAAWANATAYSVGDVVKDDSITGSYRAYVARTAGTSSGTGVDDDTGVTWEDCEEYASPELVAQVKSELDAKRPVGIAADQIVYAVLKKTQNINISVSGTDVDTTALAEKIQSFMKGLTGGRTLYVAQLISEAIDAGADNATVVTPASDVTVTWGATTYERIWPGQITVNTV